MGEIDYRVEDGVAVIRLAAPGRRNALTVPMAGDLIEAALTAERDLRIGAVVVTGGEHFCAGAQREVLAEVGRDPAREEAFRNLETIYQSFVAVGRIAVPTIAAVRGAAVGAGVNLALATDLRIIAHGARLMPGFSRIGLHPGGGHFTLLNRSAGREASAALGLFGEQIDGDRAVELGVAWAAYDDAEVEPAALDLARRAAADPELSRLAVANFRRETAAGGLPWEVAVEMERPAQMWSLRRRHEAG